MFLFSREFSLTAGRQILIHQWINILLGDDLCEYSCSALINGNSVNCCHLVCFGETKATKQALLPESLDYQKQ